MTLRRSLGRPPTPSRTPPMTREELKRRVIELHDQGRGDHQIADETRLAVGYIRQVISEARANS